MKNLLITTALISVASVSMASEKKVNFKTNPFGLAFGSANVSATLAPTENIGVGLGLAYANQRVDGSDITTTGVTLDAGYYFSGVFEDTGFVKGFVAGASVSSDDVFVGDSASVVGVIAGYQWMWDNFNTSLGGGFQTIDVDGLVTVTAPALEWTIGYAI